MNSTENILVDDFKINDDIDLNLKTDFDLDESRCNDENDEKVINKEPDKLLTEEIRSFRQKNKEFAATNDHQTYLVVVFSTKEDKDEFLKNVKIDTHTIVDGYELARKINIEPKEPKFKLGKPLIKK